MANNHKPILLIDNYDSFTYNLAHYFGELGQSLVVARNDEISLDEIYSLVPSAIVISPGPGTPEDAGISLTLVREFADKVPILGVCLGHQTIGQAFGGSVVRAREIVHGKTSLISHQGSDIFASLPTPFRATRYHSLVIEKASLPACLEVTAWTANESGIPEEIMGLKHKTLPAYGVQFHPESILSEHGHQLLKNFLAIAS